MILENLYTITISQKWDKINRFLIFHSFFVGGRIGDG